MYFNSFHFAAFLPIVFILYWVIGGRRREGQNLLLILASYYFYACWDWKFLFLLIFSTLLDYSCALLIEKQLVKFDFILSLKEIDTECYNFSMILFSLSLFFLLPFALEICAGKISFPSFKKQAQVVSQIPFLGGSILFDSFFNIEIN